MPCIIIKTNQAIPTDRHIKCCQTLSSTVSAILKKPETYIMTMLEQQPYMTMSGSTDPAVYVELKSIDLPETQTAELAELLCMFLSENLGVATDRIYIEFTNVQRHLWGWDCKTF